MKFRVSLLLPICFCSTAASQVSSLQEPDAVAFMRATVATYRAMSSYRDRGRVVQTLKSSLDDNDPAAVTQEFVTLFERPDRFKFAWTTSAATFERTDIAIDREIPLSEFSWHKAQ